MPRPPFHLGLDEAETRAVCTILGGPNGSGKSSLYDALGLPGIFINADVVARGIDPHHPENVSLAAGRIVLGELDRLLGLQADFVYETTLSSQQSISIMRRARDSNYEVGLVFVGLRDVNLNIRRVAQRVAEGGHHIAEPIVRRRYTASLRRLAEAIRLAHGTMIFDNSELAGPALIIQIERGVIRVNALKPLEPFHTRVAMNVATALSMSVEDVFRTP